MSTDNIQQEKDRIWQLLEGVPDPEVPALSVVDLGIVRAVEVEGETNDFRITLTVTPTYSGCPALDAIGMNIRLKLLEAGYRQIAIKESLSPAWTTDWMSAEGKRKLKEYGIAPPNPRGRSAVRFSEEAVSCPRCGSDETRLLSEFSSTACKAMYQCTSCLEAFDYFKCH